MSYAGKSHAHRDEKNDYSRLDKKSEIEVEIENSKDEDTEDCEDGNNQLDYVTNASAIMAAEYSRGVKDAGI